VLGTNLCSEDAQRRRALMLFACKDQRLDPFRLTERYRGEAIETTHHTYSRPASVAAESPSLMSCPFQSEGAQARPISLSRLETVGAAQFIKLSMLKRTTEHSGFGLLHWGMGRRGSGDCPAQGVGAAWCFCVLVESSASIPLQCNYKKEIACY